MQFVDTHCHIQDVVEHMKQANWLKRYEQAGSPTPEMLLASAQAAGVTRLICVGTTLGDSVTATDFAAAHTGAWASIGLHPHEAKKYAGDSAALDQFAALAAKPKVVAIGECGLDYFYTHSDKEDQIKILRFQIELALKHDLPMIFHVREAFDDFWPIFDEYPGIRGVIHSFSSNEQDLEQILRRGLHVGLNGIMTFTKDPAQLAAAKAVPLDKLVLETDAPFLTPTPYRGRMCEPKHVSITAAFLAELRGESNELLAIRTTENARRLFGLE